MIPSHLKYLAMLAIVSVAVGCQSGKPGGWKFAKSWDIRKAAPWHHDELEPPEIPMRIVSTWTDTVLHKKGQKPVRGFGGRLVFFGRATDEPVRVAGQLVVYAFDETQREMHDTRPTRKYVFPAEQFVRHESPSKMGPSYSVWLPWDEVGGEQKNISLIARFETHDGPLVIGEQTRHLLPGTSIANGKPSGGRPTNYLQAASQIRQGQLPQSNTATPGQIRLASAAIATEKQPATAKKRMTTSTIRLPASWK